MFNPSTLIITDMKQFFTQGKHNLLEIFRVIIISNSFIKLKIKYLQKTDQFLNL